MKRAWPVLFGGFLLALLAYGGSYFLCSAPSRHIERAAVPELAWLQTEFHVSNNEFARISKLHETYSTACVERCKRIDAKNAEIETLLAASSAVTPEIEKGLQEAAQLRAECQKAMLEHFYEVSKTMPPDQGRRYLAWMVGCTLGPQHEMMTSGGDAAAHEHHGE